MQPGACCLKDLSAWLFMCVCLSFHDDCPEESFLKAPRLQCSGLAAQLPRTKGNTLLILKVRGAKGRSRQLCTYKLMERHCCQGDRIHNLSFIASVVCLFVCAQSWKGTALIPTCCFSYTICTIWCAYIQVWLSALTMRCCSGWASSTSKRSCR